MSRDKYSEDHEIEVDGGTGTLTVGGNLVIATEQITGNLTVTGSVDFADTTAPIGLSNTITNRIRIPGIAFRPKTPTDFTNVTYALGGRAEFSSTQATLQAPILNLPHGSLITGIRMRGQAEDAGDTLDLTLYETDTIGSGATSIGSISWSAEGSFPFGHDSGIVALDIPSDGDIDYYNDDDSTFYLYVQGHFNSGTGQTSLQFVDVIYTYSILHQDSELAPA